MPKPLPKLRFHTASGKFFIAINGKPIYFPKGWTQVQAETERLRLLAEWESSGRVPGKKREEPPTISMLYAAYWAHVIQHYVDADGTPTSEQGVIRMALR